jgi:hypothetical protein
MLNFFRKLWNQLFGDGSKISTAKAGNFQAIPFALRKNFRLRDMREWSRAFNSRNGGIVLEKSPQSIFLASCHPKR